MSVRKLIDYYDKLEQMYNEIPDARSYDIIQPDHYNKRLKIATETLKDIWDVTIPYEPVECGDVIEVDHIDNLCKAGLELCNWLEKEFDPKVNYEFRYYLFHDYGLNTIIRNTVNRAKRVFFEFMPKEQILLFDDFDKFPSPEAYDCVYYIYDSGVYVKDSWLIVEQDREAEFGRYVYISPPFKQETKFYIEDFENTFFSILLHIFIGYFSAGGIEMYYEGGKTWIYVDGKEFYFASPKDIGLKKVNILESIISFTKTYVILNGQVVAQVDRYEYTKGIGCLDFYFWVYPESKYNLAIDYIKFSELRGEDI